MSKKKGRGGFYRGYDKLSCPPKKKREGTTIWTMWIIWIIKERKKKKKKEIGIGVTRRKRPKVRVEVS